MNQYGKTFRQHEESPLRTGRAQSKNLTTGDGRNQASLQCEFGVAEEVTVVIDNGAPGAGITAFATATVEFTIDGTTTVRQFDVAAGACISGVAQAVRVSVKDSTPSSHAQGKSYGVTLSVAVMPRPTTAVPPVLTGALAQTVTSGGGTLTVPVPNGADSVVVFGVVWPGYPSFQVAQQTADGLTTLLETAVTPGQFVPLIAGCGQIVITNFGTITANVTVAFGIDG